MIVLPCTLPLAFVIVPLSMGKGAVKGFGIAVAFGLGVAITLSFYGVLAAVIGEVAIGSLRAPLEAVKNWLYFIAGLFAYLFAIGEIGLWKFRMPSYSGAAPVFIQRQGDYFKALLLGLFLGNIGVGCPHPATPVLLTRIAVSGDVFYGWALFFVHAIGRVLPLLLLALLGILGMNALSWLVARRERVERATGWAMIFVAGFILVLGLFSHDWWVYSGQHTLLEEITQEEKFLGIISKRLGVEPPHAHGIPTGRGLFDLPFWLGNWILVLLWILPFWFYYFKKKKALGGLPEEERKIEQVRIPYRFWLFLTLSLLLALIFIWVLPDRFLNHTVHPGEMMKQEMMMQEEEGHEAGHQEVTAPSEAGFKIELRREGGMLDFAIRDLRDEIIQNPDIVHDRPMHVFVIREGDLQNFSHIHPGLDLQDGHFKIFYSPSASGSYRVFAEATVKGRTSVFEFPATVFGEAASLRAFPDFRRFIREGPLTYIFLREENIRAGRETDFTFKVSDPAGRILRLGKYLGENMHIEIISEDLRHFHHIHAEYGSGNHHGSSLIEKARANGGEEHDPNELNFEFAFPEPGIYKMVLEFELEEEPGLYHKAEFWVEAKENVFRLELSRATLVIISLLLIAILLPFVNWYVNAKEI